MSVSGNKMKERQTKVLPLFLLKIIAVDTGELMKIIGGVKPT